MQSAWGDEDGIALVEEAAVLLTLQEEGSSWTGRDVLWFVDNSVIVSAMCKGASHSPAVDEGAVMLHLVLARFQLRVWWEYVESKANWSDKMSREYRDHWLESIGFTCFQCELRDWPWAGAGTRWQRVMAVGSALGGSALGK